MSVFAAATWTALSGHLCAMHILAITVENGGKNFLLQRISFLPDTQIASQ